MMRAGTGISLRSFLPGWLKDPFVFLAVIVYITAFTGLLLVPAADWREAVYLLAGLSVACIAVRLILKGYKPPGYAPAGSLKEAASSILYLVFILFLTILTATTGIDIVNAGTGWLFFVIMPVVTVGYFRIGKSRLIDSLRSFGFTARGFSYSVQAGAAVCVILLPFLLLSAPAAHRGQMIVALQDPVHLAVAFPTGFAIALSLIAIPEEAFFRGILQPRLEWLCGSPVRALLAASFIFGLMHLPYAYFTPTWPMHGDLFWSFSNFVTTQAATGVMLGYIWIRTHSLVAPSIVHAFIDATTFMTQY